MYVLGNRELYRIARMSEPTKRHYAKRWCFTINMQHDDDKQNEYDCWGLSPADAPQGDWYKYKDDIQYLHFQEECGENGTHHLQGFLILKKRVSLPYLKKFHPRAHWEVTRGTDTEADEYTKKKDTKVEGGMELTIGEAPKAPEVMDNKQTKALAISTLDQIKREGFKRPADIPSAVLMQPGFIQAYHALTAAALGENRGEVKVLTLIGPPGTGKSFAINKYFPVHCRCLKGNNGIWFQNPLEDVCVFEEFDGSGIDIQRMKQLLDPYPNALEVKGATFPACYTKVIITSNIPPNLWYRDLSNDANAGTAAEKRTLNIRAIYDRIGYSAGGYIPARTSGTYCEAPYGLSIDQTRAWFDQEVRHWAGIEDDPIPPPAAAAADLSDSQQLQQDRRDLGYA